MVINFGQLHIAYMHDAYFALVQDFSGPNMHYYVLILSTSRLLNLRWSPGGAMVDIHKYQLDGIKMFSWITRRHKTTILNEHC